MLRAYEESVEGEESAEGEESVQGRESGPAASTALDLLDRARVSLLEACHSSETTERYVQAQLGALRAAAALAAARAVPSVQSGPRSLWDIVPVAAPELAEWAEFFELATVRRFRLLCGGASKVSARDADDLLRQAETFLDLVCRSLGLPVDSHPVGVLVPTTPSGSVPLS